MKIIAEELGKMYRGEITSDRAAARLVTELSLFEMAEFIVDAYNRGWITNFNLGLDEDGKPI